MVRFKISDVVPATKPLTRLVKDAVPPVPFAGFSGSTMLDTTSLTIDQMITDEAEPSSQDTSPPSSMELLIGGTAAVEASSSNEADLVSLIHGDLTGRRARGSTGDRLGRLPRVGDY